MTRFSFVILTACLFIITLTDNSSALRLNEIEANPEGPDPGFEWVELYSEDNVNLEGYSLDHEGRGAILNLSGSFQGFFVINFQTQWLRNNNETIYLKLNGNVVDTAGPFSDNKKEKTYSFCNIWIFTSSTQNGANACSSSSGSGGTSTQNPTRNQSQQSSNTAEQEEEPRVIRQNNEIKNNTQNKVTNLAVKSDSVQQPKKIVLNSKTADKDNSNVEITKTYKTRVGVIYFFMGLCVLLVVLIALRKL